MSQVIEAVFRHSRLRPQAKALSGCGLQINYASLAQCIEETAAKLPNSDQPLALFMDNSPAWAIADLAAVFRQRPCIPVPLFFSPGQIRHLVRKGGVATLLTDFPEQWMQIAQVTGMQTRRLPDIDIAGRRVASYEVLLDQDNGLPKGTAKVTFTSGTTGEPKGVCLAQKAMEKVAASLCEVTGANNGDKHLCLLPLAILLENVGGLYASLLAGASCMIPSLRELGFTDASSLDSTAFYRTVQDFGPSTCILVPQTLQALVFEAAQTKPLETLRFAAVGGAPVSLKLLAEAEALGLPIYEGYGLSEAASVVSVNRPDGKKVGSVGLPLPHVELRFAEDGEILVRGSLFLGYLGETPINPQAFWPTGDLGQQDEDGYLYLKGRKKNVFITAYGRNIAPEWLEKELTVEPAIHQACVFGEGRPFVVAVIVPRHKDGRSAVTAAVESANARLPAYARIRRWIIADEPFTIANGQWTGTGRPRRKQICDRYRDAIDRLYEEGA